MRIDETITIMAIIGTVLWPGAKVTTVIILIIKMLVYSAIKIRANNPLPYSTLNPETSSDSPSERSKGVRLVSARDEMNHRRHTGRSIRSGL